MASLLDRITDTRNAARPNSARATGTRSSGGTSLACDSLSGWPTASKVHFVTYQIDSNSNPVAGTQLDCYGIVSGNTIGSFTMVDGTDTGNQVNDVVEMLPTAAWGQDLADALNAEHNRDGTHSDITADTLVIGTGTTLPAGDIGTADIANGAVTGQKLSNTNSEWKTFTPAGNTDITSGSMTDWVTGFSNVTIPSWATKARVTFSVGFTCGAASADSNIRLVIGAANGTTFQLSKNSFPTSGVYYFTYIDEITLSGSGSQAIKIQCQRTAGTGFIRSGPNHDYTMKIEYIA